MNSLIINLNNYKKKALLGGDGSRSTFNLGQPFSSTQSTQQEQQQQQQQPGATPFWADPNFIQASMRMQQMMANNNNNNTNNNTTNATPQENSQQNLLQQMMMGFPSGGFG